MLSPLRLLPTTGKIVAGQALFDGEDLLALSPAEFRAHRWRDLSIVFQGAMNALNPVRTVGDQLREAITAHLPWPRTQVDARVSELLELVWNSGLARDTIRLSIQRRYAPAGDDCDGLGV